MSYSPNGSSKDNKLLLSLAKRRLFYRQRMYNLEVAKKTSGRYASTPELNAELLNTRILSSIDFEEEKSEGSVNDLKAESPKSRRGSKLTAYFNNMMLGDSGNENGSSPSHSPRIKTPSILRKFAFFGESNDQLSKSNSKSDSDSESKPTLKKSVSFPSNNLQDLGNNELLPPRLFNIRRTQSTSKNRTPDEKKMIYNEMVQCILTDECKSLKSLLKRRIIDLNDSGEPSSLLHEASYKGCIKCMRAIIKNGGKVNIADGAGWTALHASVLATQLEAVKFLIENNASVNAVSTAGWSPLHLAVYINNLDIVHELYYSGADPLLTNQKDISPFQLAINFSKSLILDYFLQLPYFLVDT